MVAQPQPAPRNRIFRRILASGLIIVLMLVVGTLIAGAIARSNLGRQYPPPGQLVDVGGYRMHIQCLGQGSPTVILSAGLDDFSIFWSLVQPEVVSFTRVCAYDRAGLGWSAPGPNARTSETMVKELHTLLANAKVDGPYVLVGHSFAGGLARLYAHRLEDMPLRVLSAGEWMPLPGVSAAEDQQAWQAWQDMQSGLAALSSNSQHISAEHSGHNIQLEQPQLVIDAIRSIVQETRR